MPEVSVIMPVYNTKEQYLRAAIESILAQTFTDFEFLILDDCPENAGETIVKSYSDHRIKYFSNEKNLGIARSYNRLLNIAQGRYIAIMNHDDISLPARLAEEVSFLDYHPEVGLVGTGYKKFGVYNRFRKIINPSDDANIKASLLFKSTLHHPTTMFRKNLVDEYQIIYEPQFISLNDRKFYYDIGRVAKLANIGKILYKYRFHAQMTSRISHSEIVREQHLFHSLFFAGHDIEMSRREKDIFDNCIACGRYRVKDTAILEEIRDVLEKLTRENQEKHFLPQKEFSETCAKYLVKKCCTAAICGRLNSAKLLAETSLPVAVPLRLKIWNSLNFGGN